MSSQEQTDVKRLPPRLGLVYALGQFGWSLLFGLLSNYLNWFYEPPADAGIALRIPGGVVAGFLTVLGIVAFGGRLFDAITDPLVAKLSDRSKHPLGRRIPFMRWSAIPAALFLVLVFVSPVPEQSALNLGFLVIALLGFYFAYTAYVTPYMSLLSELGQDDKHKLDLATYISLTWFLGFAVSSQAPLLWGLFEGSIDKNSAVILAMAILSGLGLVFMLIPAFALDERRWVRSRVSDEPLAKSLAATLGNRNFRVFLLSDLAYWFALTIFQTGMLYFITVLIGQSEQASSVVIPIAGVLSFVCYPLVNLLAKKTGKKPLLVVGFGLFVLVMIVTALAGPALSAVGFAPESQPYLIAVLFGLPLALFGILPNAIIADVADGDARVSGQSRQAMFFGTRTFVQKLGQSIGLLVFNSLLLLGKSAGDDTGIRVAAVVAAAVMLVSGLFFLLYREKEVLAQTSANAG